MVDSARVLNHGAGDLRARALFVGEAPGRLGADATEIPFHGDAAGNNFEELLAFAGISRGDVFVTNAVLCNPKDDRGNNATPNRIETGNCSGFLRRQVELISPSVVITLGAVALEALKSIESHALNLRDHVRTTHQWYGRLLIPLYHPGQRAMVHRSLANQRSDYQFVAETIRRVDAKRRVPSGASKSDVVALARLILSMKGKVSYFELHKLAYLAEYLYVRRTGTRLTKAYFVRQKDGPYCTDLQLTRLQRAEPGIQVTKSKGQLFLSYSSGHSAHLFQGMESAAEAAAVAAQDAIQRYSYDSEFDLKTAVYMTAPMRNILRRERAENVNLHNAPIDFLAAR
jgi:uracil-DNA glycosylase family 4